MCAHTYVLCIFTAIYFFRNKCFKHLAIQKATCVHIHIATYTYTHTHLCNSCNMCSCDLSDMYALSPQARGPQAYTSGKSPVPMLQPLYVESWNA